MTDKHLPRPHDAKQSAYYSGWRAYAEGRSRPTDEDGAQGYDDRKRLETTFKSHGWSR
jgi:hypothetical protein